MKIAKHTVMVLGLSILPIGCEGKGANQTATEDDSLTGGTGGPTTADDSTGTEEPTTGAASETSSGSTETASTSGETDETETDDTCTFVCTTSGETGDIECDVFAQDCGPEQKCAAWDADGDFAWDSTTCVAVTGDGQHGDPCTIQGNLTGEDDCAEGVMCWNTDPDTGFGTCVELCTGSLEAPQCGPPNSFCVVANMVLNLCLPFCDPLVQDCQGNNETCLPQPNGDGFSCVLDSSGGQAPSGTPCEFANACNPGNICLNLEFFPHPDCEGSGGCCGPYCDISDPGANANCQEVLDTAECVPWYQEGTAPEPYADVGICIQPQ
ncbi:MAG: hypothetical protein R3A51_19230 [Nannocystaceae bacterium]|nr:hypothetical protein [Myxococcales bacterium]